MPVTHPFVSAKSDGGDATLVRPSNWNANHSGNNDPTLIVAATDSSSKDVGLADYTCDGTADDVQIQAALDALPTLGGAVILAPGTYTLAATVTVTANKRILISGYGALVKLAASTTGFKINQGISSTRGVLIEGVRIDGQSNASTIGIELIDTNNSQVYAVEVGNCATGIQLNSNAASNFVEGSSLLDVLLRSNTTGVNFVVGAGTGSFMQTMIRGLKCVVGGTGTGMVIPNSALLLRAVIQGTFWIDTNQTGVSIDANMEDATLDLAVEGAGGATGNTAVTIGTNATNLDQSFIKLMLTGTIATQLSNAFTKVFHYWSGGSQIVQTSGTAVLGYKRHGDSANRFQIEALTAGGKLSFGTGGIAVDTEIHRSAADVLASADKFDPASLSLQTKAGVPVDGDITGGAADGDIVVDTTNNKIMVRIGGTWKGVVVA